MLTGWAPWLTHVGTDGRSPSGPATRAGVAIADLTIDGEAGTS